MNESIRQEKKFLILTDEYFRYRNYFSKVIQEDPHNGKDGYTVRTLYFDSIEDKDYFEKINGKENRRKIRLRIYHPTDQSALLEIKQKQGNYQRKRSLRIKREDAIKLTRGDYSPLLNYEEELAMECFGLLNLYCYRPKTVIEYQREAFIVKENNIRITFDRNIRASESCFDLFYKKLNMDPVFDPFHVVLEVKYKNFLLSYVKDMINECGRSEISASKYCMGRSTMEMF